MTDPDTAPSREAASVPSGFSAELFAKCREMVEKQIRERGVSDPRVLDALMVVPRHVFVLPEFVADAYNDQPLPTGEGQTISQPYMVGSMTEALELSGSERVLEIGTGSGYQTAILSLLASTVYTIESSPALGAIAREHLHQLGYRNIFLRVADGTLGWPEEAPFDAILVTAAAPRIPPPLVEQLAEGGRLVLPVGSSDTQELVRVRRKGGAIFTEHFYHCRFVPLIGRYGWSDPKKDP